MDIAKKVAALLRLGQLEGIERVLAITVKLTDEGVIGRYALGGAVAAYTYIEPQNTKDIDFFISVSSPGIVDLSPIWSHLIENYNAHWDGQFLVVAGWKTEFLPVSGPLEEDALQAAIIRQLKGLPVRVLGPEHLGAIMLKTGRPSKDDGRLLQFLDAEVMNIDKFLQLVQRFDLTDQWQKFKTRYDL